jgi:UDP-glucose 4-epimerase
MAPRRSEIIRVFISGCAGFLGSWLAEEFLAKGWEVVGADNLLGGYESNIPQGVDFTEADCDDFEDIEELLEGCDVVYHCAASAYEGLSVFSPTIVTKNTYLTTAALVAAAVDHKVGRFVYLSSMARYGDNAVPFTEAMYPRPLDPYAIAKVASEQLIETMGRAHGLEWVVAVPHNIYGPHQKYDDPFRNVVSIFINTMLRGNQPYIYGDGNQRRCFSFILDDIPVLASLATAPKEKVVGQVFNIGPDKEFVTINELARVVAEVLGFDLHPRHILDRPLEVKNANCSADKARHILGYSTSYSLKQGVAATADWIQRAGPKPFVYHIEPEIVNQKLPATWRDRLFQ